MIILMPKIFAFAFGNNPEIGSLGARRPMVRLTFLRECALEYQPMRSVGKAELSLRKFRTTNRALEPKSLYDRERLVDVVLAWRKDPSLPLDILSRSFSWCALALALFC